MSTTQYLTTLAIHHNGAVEVTEDFELPEYQPEIRRAAGVQCTVTRDSAFLEGNEIQISGCVLYTVLYLSGDGGMASAPLFSTWSAAVPLPEEGGIGVEDLHILADSENIVCRVTGPRKLNLSARVRLRCTALGESDCSAAGTREEQAGMVCRMEETPVARMKTCRQTGTVAGELTASDIPGTAAAPGEETSASAGTPVITCRGIVQISEARRVPEGLSVTGEAAVRFLVRGREGSYVTLRDKAPITAVIPCPGPLWENSREPEEVTAAGKCAALTVSAGEDGVIHWEMEYDLEGVLFGKNVSARAADGYSTTHEALPVFRQADSVAGGSCVRGQVTLTGEKALRGELERTENLQFLYGWGRGVFEKGEALPGGRMLLTGTAYCTALLTGNGDVTAEDIALPIRYECDGGMVNTDTVPDCRCSFSVWDVGGHLDGTVLHLHAEAGCEGIVLHRGPCSWLDSLTLQAPLPPARPAVILYTPAPGETLWDVQKRYRTDNIVETDGRFVVCRP